jgi:hypothetical protein
LELVPFQRTLSGLIAMILCGAVLYAVAALTLDIAGFRTAATALLAGKSRVTARPDRGTAPPGLLP